ICRAVVCPSPYSPLQFFSIVLALSLCSSLFPYTTLFRSRGLLTDSIGLITGDFTNPFYSALAEGLEGEIRDHQMHLSVANARECPEQEWRLARYLADLQPRALVVVSAMVDHSRYAALQPRGIPVRFVDRPAAGIAAGSVAA